MKSKHYFNFHYSLGAQFTDNDRDAVEDNNLCRGSNMQKFKFPTRDLSVQIKKATWTPYYPPQ